jgi:hypothetical protein
MPDEPSRTDRPLWAIGLVVIVVLAAPMLLYSLAPTGPLREGDTVFSHGQQRAHVMRIRNGSAQEDQEICLLDPGNPLVVIERPIDPLDGTLVARVQGHSAVEWPFCPSHAEVRLMIRQIVQKPDLLTELKDRLTRLFGG